MRDIDFEELDKAVNRFLGMKESKNKRAATANNFVNEDRNVVASPRNASEFHRVASSTPRGRFMDIVPAHHAVQPSITAERPLKYTSKAKTENVSPSIKDDFNAESIRVRSKKTTDLKDNLETIKPVDFNLEEIDYQAPVLDHTEIEESSVVNEDQREVAILGDDNHGRTLEVIDRDPVTVNRPISPAPMRVGVFPIEENKEMVIFGSSEGKVEKVLPEIKSKYSDGDVDSYDFFSEFKNKPVAEIEKAEKPAIVGQIKKDVDSIESLDTAIVKPKQTENPRIEKEKTLGIDDLTPANPFLPNARIEKRPLGSPRSSGSNPQMLESKIVGTAQVKPQKSSKTESRQPILSSEDYATPIVRPKRKSGWLSVLIILIIIVVCGAGLGLLAHFLTM